uniref:Uncharacterized protein n=1 Tax=Rhizophora mucronata TaxID=61149 RepID=A0A2P2QIV0_RHIMU
MVFLFLIKLARDMS